MTLTFTMTLFLVISVFKLCVSFLKSVEFYPKKMN